MSNRLALLLGVHAHQPVGNFEAVVDDAHLRCYRPFLHTLFRYPDFRFAAHFSGWLVAELAQRFPSDMALLRKMVARGQVELFGAGDCEPVLAAIPARDRRGQLQALADRLASQFGQRPGGAWLTERVWEATVVPALRETGHRYVTVDDYHFLCTGMPASALDGYYTTEEDGGTLDLFPISEQLRYRLPFSPAADAVAYLEAQADEGRQAAVYFDDIEKFGIWPETYAWVYEQRWLEQFIEGVLASPKLVATTYAGFHASHRSRGIVYLPTASYSEMNEWTLPAAAAGDYAGLLERVKAGERWEQERAFVRGGIWRNFFSRYPESNWMHKRMLGLSARLAAAPASADSAGLQENLYRAQANDAYWHGLFGGLYLPHLRRAVWRNLIALEAGLDALAPRESVAAQDVDSDGAREHFVRHADLQVVLRDDGLGAAHEFISYALQHNFGDTLRRYAEHYHRVSPQRPAHSDEPVSGIASAHDRVAFKTEITAADLAVDAHGRVLFVDCLCAADGGRTPLRNWQIISADGQRLELTHALADAQAGLRKTWQLTASGLEVSYSGELPAGLQLETEVNLALPSCDGYGGRYVAPDGHFPGGFGAVLEYAELCQFALEDAALGGRLDLSCAAPVVAQMAPHYTVSQSEAGFEKIMQAACLRLRWRAGEQRIALRLSPCASWL